MYTHASFSKFTKTPIIAIAFSFMSRLVFFFFDGQELGQFFCSEDTNKQRMEMAHWPQDPNVPIFYLVYYWFATFVFHMPVLHSSLKSADFNKGGFFVTTYMYFNNLLKDAFHHLYHSYCATPLFLAIFGKHQRNFNQLRNCDTAFFVLPKLCQIKFDWIWNVAGQNEIIYTESGPP